MKKTEKQGSRKQLVISKSNELRDPKGYFLVHPEIKELIWIENGTYKNYIPKDAVEHFSLVFMQEPSLINMNLEIKKPKKIVEVVNTSYYPSYKTLNPEQKYLYWQFLSNPYQPIEDIGYLFILYYGLERHIFSEDFEAAIKVVLKLREVHKNNSFQYYSGNAIVLSCILHKRVDIIQVFMESLDQGLKKGFSPNLFLLSVHSFDTQLYATDIMRISKDLDFKNTNYIKGYPELFKQTLKNIIYLKYSSEGVILKDFISEIETLSKDERKLFANVSLSDESIIVPNFLSSNRFKQELFDLLVDTHESVKKELAEMRRNKIVLKRKKKVKRSKKKLEFDAKHEAVLIDQLKENKNNAYNKHFTYMFLQDFYYKYRDLHPMYIEECIKYCKADIESLTKLSEAYKKQKIKRLGNLSNSYSKDELKDEIKRIKKGKFKGRITAFSRLAIIYEKRNDYDSALRISRQAKDYYIKKICQRKNLIKG